MPPLDISGRALAAVRLATFFILGFYPLDPSPPYAVFSLAVYNAMISIVHFMKVVSKLLNGCLFQPVVALRAIVVGGIAAFAKVAGAVKVAGGVKVGAATAAMTAAATAAISGMKDEPLTPKEK
ncbi:hypothetical protein KSP39_PZI023448 [Platanthera zijinensis]|uniref:Uncharacterized protein n=1 Tax=Platanthera zijinensis TaxID=2320716 RepID=A0AAP0ASL8_9ASPA